MKNSDDSRQDRVASEIRAPELDELNRKAKSGVKTHIYQCWECKRIFEERSLHCPFCNKGKTMGELKKI